MLVYEDALLREPNLWTPRKKPVGRVKIDWSHPLTDKLNSFLLITPNFNQKDLIESVSWSTAGTLQSANKGWPEGLGAYLNSSYDIKEASGMKYSFFPLSLLCVMRPDNDAGVVGTIGDASNWNIFYLEVDATNVKAITGGAAFPTSSLAHGGYAGVKSIVGVWTSTPTIQVFCNGKAGPEETGRTPTVTTPEMNIGTDAGGTNDANGWYQCFASWGRALSDSEALSLTNDPYQFLVPV